MPSMDDILKKSYDSGEQRQMAGPRIPYTRLAVGDKVRVRFLMEFTKVPVLWQHEQVKTDNGYRRRICLRNQEYDTGLCPYCKAGYPRRLVAFFPVWNYHTHQVELATAKRTTFSFWSTLQEFYDSEGTILANDWMLSRRAELNNTGRQVSAYIALPLPKSEFTVQNVSVPTYEDLIERLRPREISET